MYIYIYTYVYMYMDFLGKLLISNLHTKAYHKHVQVNINTHILQVHMLCYNVEVISKEL